MTTTAARTPPVQIVDFLVSGVISEPSTIKSPPTFVGSKYYSLFAKARNKIPRAFVPGLAAHFGEASIREPD